MIIKDKTYMLRVQRQAGVNQKNSRKEEKHKEPGLNAGHKEHKQVES